MFCDKSLIDYRTQDAPDLMGFFLVKGDQDTRNLEVKPNEKSRRLSPEMLIEHWERSTEDTSSEWPPWLKGDSVLCRIGRQNDFDDHQETNERLREARAKYGTPSSIFTEDRSDVEMSDGTTPSTPVEAPYSGENLLIMARNKPKIKDSSLSCDKLGDTRIGPQRSKRKKKITYSGGSQLRGPSGIRKNATVTKRWRENKFMKPTRRTRSQKVSKFYELAADGTTRIS